MPDELAEELGQALRSGRLELYYQPIVSLKRSRVVGLEALARWEHPQRGQVSPTEFIEVAERSGLIVELGKWALMQACKTLSRWIRHGVAPRDLTLAVNVSPRQWMQHALLDDVRAALEASDLAPGQLKLEITESSAMDDPDSVMTLVTKLRDIGVKICLDDFGTGHSSLAHLKSFPVDTLKIDRSFVQGMDNDAKSIDIVSSIINLAHTLGLDVVAEGVETNNQRRQLAKLNCEYAQGFLFSRPMDERDAVGYLAGFVELTRPDGALRVPEDTAEHDRVQTRPGEPTAVSTAPRLVVRSGPSMGQVVSLQGGEIVIGRSPDATLTLRDAHVSRHHARIHQETSGKVFLADLGSRNGTYCNGQRIEKCPLKDGDRVRIGHTVMELWFGR